MFTFIGIIVTAIVGIYGGYALITKMSANSDNPLSSLSDKSLIKKFNKLIASVSGCEIDKLDALRDRIFVVLKEWKKRKEGAFIDAAQKLEKNKLHIEQQIEKQNKLIKNMELKAKELVSDDMSEKDYERGGKIMARIETLETNKAKLEDTKTAVETRIANLDEKIDDFNFHYTMKENEITEMIVAAQSDCDVSTIDINLNDLIVEYKETVIDRQVEQKVKAKIADMPEDELAESATFNENRDAYIDKFKTFVGQGTKKSKK